MAWRSTIPWSLVIFRLLLAPTIAIVAVRGSLPGPWLAALFVTGPLSDLFDGVLARRWGTATAALRIADTLVDIVFYVLVLIVVVVLHWPAMRERIWLVAAVVALEAVRAAFDLIKFKKIASYHTYSAKFWGFLLMAAVSALLWLNYATWLLTAALVWGMLSELEGLMFSVMLPEWTHDVKTIAHVLAIRRKLSAKNAAHAS